MGIFASGAWWLDQLVSWVVFGLIATGIVAGLSGWVIRRYERRRDEPYSGWGLQIYGFPPKDADCEAYALLPDEVKRFVVSDFELGKFVKGVVSGTAMLSLRRIAEAKGKWVFLDRDKREIKIDFREIPPEHLVRGTWLGDPPAGWKYAPKAGDE